MGTNVAMDDRPTEEGSSLACVRAQKGLIHLALSKRARRRKDLTNPVSLLIRKRFDRKR